MVYAVRVAGRMRAHKAAVSDDDLTVDDYNFLDLYDDYLDVFLDRMPDNHHDD